MSSRSRGRGEDESYSGGEGDGSDSQEQSVVDNRGVDDGDCGSGDGGGGDGGDDGDRGADDSPKTLSEVHAMLTALLRHFNVPLPKTRIEDDAKRKRHRVRRLKSKMITLAATPAARGFQPLIHYILTELPRIIHEILR
jgi:hypothetical protein